MVIIIDVTITHYNFHICTDEILKIWFKVAVSNMSVDRVACVVGAVELHRKM